jgi:hypothetical protein
MQLVSEAVNIMDIIMMYEDVENDDNYKKEI